jgi:methyl-accepting chemotaxis protein
MRFTIGRKLRLGFLAIIVLMGAIGATSTTKMMGMGDKAEEIQTIYMPSMKLLGDIKGDFINIQRLALRFTLETDASEKDRLEKKINTTISDIQQLQNTYEPLIDNEEGRNLFKSFLKTEQELADSFPSLINAGKANDFKSANKNVGDMKTPFNNALDTIEKLIEINSKETEKATEASVKLNKSGKRLVDILSILALVLGIVIALFLTRIISGPMVLMAKAAKQIASGDLTGDEIKVKNRDEIGDLAASFNEMRNNLQSLIQKVEISAEHVAASSEELTASSEQIREATEQIALTIEKVAVGSEKQTRSIDESASSVNELSIGVHHIAANAESVTHAAIQASEIALEGNQTIQTTVNQMNAINRTVDGLAQAVKGLGERSQEIGHIVEVITGIATQTNLLALNAAIEAARVGEHGSGFAVVANEVRKLAEQSKQSAEQIAQLIAAIQDETTQAVQLMEAGTQEVAEGIHAVHIAGESFERIQRSVNDVANQIQEVSAASQQMSASTEQVVHSINVISGIAETTSSGSQHVSAAVEEQLASMEEITASAAALSKMSEELQVLLGKFKV